MNKRSFIRTLIGSALGLGAGLVDRTALSIAHAASDSKPGDILWGYPGAVFEIRPGDDCKVNGKNICAIKVERTHGNGRAVSFKDK